MLEFAIIKEFLAFINRKRDGKGGLVSLNGRGGVWWLSYFNGHNQAYLIYDLD